MSRLICSVLGHCIVSRCWRIEASRWIPDLLTKSVLNYILASPSSLSKRGQTGARRCAQTARCGPQATGHSGPFAALALRGRKAQDGLVGLEVGGGGRRGSVKAPSAGRAVWVALWAPGAAGGFCRRRTVWRRRAAEASLGFAGARRAGGVSPAVSAPHRRAGGRSLRSTLRGVPVPERATSEALEGLTVLLTEELLDG